MPSFTCELFWIFGSLFAVLTLASAIGYGLKRRTPGDIAVENLTARIRSWWIMVLIGGGALLAGPTVVVLLFALLSFVALREFLTQTPVRRSDHSALFACFFVVLPVQYLLIARASYGLFAIWIPVYGFLALPLLALIFTDTKEFLHRTPLLVVFIVSITQASDILQYIWGKLFGKHAIAPVLSPSKTVEGFAGGVLSAALLGALLSPITPFNAWQSGLMALLIASLGFLGRLVLSAIKRDRGIKDWSQLIEGHGGMLDRLDSLCFSAPVFFHLTRYFFSER